MTKTAEQPHPLGPHMPMYSMQGSTPLPQKICLGTLLNLDIK